MRRKGLAVSICSLIWGATLLATAQEPDQLIAFASRQDNHKSDIFTIQLNGENRTNLTNHPADDIDPDWSPDGTQIAFSSNRDGDYDIWVMDADGSNLIKVIDTEENEFEPNWSPDGTCILCMEVDGNRLDKRFDKDICLISLEDSSIAILTDELASNYDGAWSPDGKQIVFVSIYDAAGPSIELYTMRLEDPHGLKRLTNNQVYETNPHWISENGIMFSSYGGIYEMSLDTLERQLVLDPLHIHLDVAVENGVLQLVFDGLDGLWYFNPQSGVYFNVDNTHAFDDSLSLRPSMQISTEE